MGCCVSCCEELCEGSDDDIYDYDYEREYDFDDISDEKPYPKDDDDDDADSDPGEPPAEHYRDDPENSGLKYWTVDFRRSQGADNSRKTRPAVQPGQMYVDRKFPLARAIREYKKQGLRWKRPQEIVKNPVLFSKGTSRFDIYQRNFGTCWFLSMMSNLAEKPELCKKVINEQSYRPKTDGVVHCRLWRFGQWEDVYMDDFLPVYYNGRYFTFYGAMSGTNSGEMWVSLLEKSLARLHGSYNVVSDDGGYPSDAYITLTGGVAERLSLSQDMDNENAIRVFRRIKNALKSGAMVTCAVPSKYDNQMGLVGGHAYSLTGASWVKRRNGDNIPLVRIRNPHGTNEWNGKWSDKSEEWSTLAEGGDLLRERNDGEFWINLQDFCHYFTQTTVCSLTPDYDVDGRSDSLCYVLRIFGQWRRNSAVGEGRTLQERLRNPKFEFTIPEEGEKDNGDVPLVVQLIQRAEHLDYDHMRCDLYHVRQGSVESGKLYVRKVYDNETKEFYAPALQSSFRFRLRPGRFLVVPSTYKGGITKQFLLRIYASSPLTKCRYVPSQVSVLLR